MPVSGARKTADMPAAAPQMSMMRRSRAVEAEVREAAEMLPEPGADGRAAVDAGAFERGAAAAADGGDGGEKLGQEGAHVDGALVLVVGADDLLGGVLVRVGREELHDEAGDGAAEDQAGNDGPVMVQVVGEDRRPELVQDDDGDGGDGEAGGEADDGRDQKPLVQVAGVGGGEVLLHLAAVLANQRVICDASVDGVRHGLSGGLRGGWTGCVGAWR